MTYAAATKRKDMNIDPNDVLVFVRPVFNPVKVVSDKDIRINYGGRFIDFRDGKARVTDENTGILVCEF